MQRAHPYPFSPLFYRLNRCLMTAENQDFLNLTDALTDLNKALLEKDCGSPCYAPSTAYGYARTGRIPAERRGRAYFVRRSDIPLIASRLPLGARRSSPSVA